MTTLYASSPSELSHWAQIYFHKIPQTHYNNQIYYEDGCSTNVASVDQAHYQNFHKITAVFIIRKTIIAVQTLLQTHRSPHECASQLTAELYTYWQSNMWKNTGITAVANQVKTQRSASFSLQLIWVNQGTARYLFCLRNPEKVHLTTLNRSLATSIEKNKTPEI